MPILIPIDRTADDASRFTLQAQLDGATYTLAFRWNERTPRTAIDGTVSSGSWFMNVLDAEGVNALMVGIRLSVDYPTTKNIVGRTPPGSFVAVDSGAAIGNGVDPGFDDLGNRVKLFYYSAAEVGGAA